MLVSDGYDAKVADFGVSLAAKGGGGGTGSGKNKLQIIEAEGTKVEGTDFYMAPELFAVTTSQLLFSLDSDVYAFGIVLYELLNRCNLLYVSFVGYMVLCVRTNHTLTRCFDAHLLCATPVCSRFTP